MVLAGWIALLMMGLVAPQDPLCPRDELARFLMRPWANAHPRGCTTEDALTMLEASPPWSDERPPARQVIVTDQGAYLLDLPENYTPRRAWPLIISLHGNPPGHGFRVHDEYWAGHAGAGGFILASPLLAGGQWRTGTGEETVLATLRDALLRFHVDQDRVFLTGYSSGGLGAWYMGTWLPELWAGLNVRCGLQTRKMGPIPNLRRIPIYLMHANSDHRCDPRNADAAARDLQERGFEHVYETFPGDHDFFTFRNGEVLEWMRNHPLRDWGELDYELTLDGRPRLLRYLLLEGTGPVHITASLGQGRVQVATKGKGKVTRARILVPRLALDRSGEVIVTLNGKTVYSGKPLKSFESFAQYWSRYPGWDPDLAHRLPVGYVDLIVPH